MYSSCPFNVNVNLGIAHTKLSSAFVVDVVHNCSVFAITIIRAILTDPPNMLLCDNDVTLLFKDNVRVLRSLRVVGSAVTIYSFISFYVFPLLVMIILSLLMLLSVVV